MKSLYLLAALWGMTLWAHAQQRPLRPYEVGVEALSYVPRASAARPQWTALSGVFFRYAPRRVGLRAAGSYGQRTTREGDNCNDCLSGDVTARTITVRGGGQCAPFSQHPWLYSFLDLAYRSTAASGRLTGGLFGNTDLSSARTARGVGAMAGIGADVRVLSRLHLVPELYYEAFRSRAVARSVDNRTAQTTQTSQPETTHTPAARLQITVAF